MIAIKQLTLFISNTPPPDQKRTRTTRTKSCHTFHVEKLIKRVYKKKFIFSPRSHRGCVRAVRGLEGQRGEPHLLEGDPALALQQPGGGLAAGQSRCKEAELENCSTCYFRERGDIIGPLVVSGILSLKWNNNLVMCNYPLIRNPSSPIVKIDYTLCAVTLARHVHLSLC